MASRKGQREQARQERLEKEAADAEKQRRQRMVQFGVGGVLLAAIVVGVLIVVSQSGGGGSSSGSGGSAKNVADVGLVQKQLAGLRQDGNVLGDPSAKTTIVEFGDPQCPICKQFSEQVAPALISGPVRDGTAKYEFQPWLIIGPQSKPAARAAFAAGEQGKFWNYLTLFYRNQGEENSGYVTDDFMTSIAKRAGVPDIAKWNSDRNSTKYDSELSAISKQANQMGFTGTPTVYVKGPNGQKVLPGVPTAAAVEAALKSVS